MYVTCEYECWKLNSAGSERVDELQITKKQTPAWLCTHVMLEVLVLPSTQTIRTFWFSFSALVRGLATASIKKGKSSKSRIVQLSNVVDILSKNLDRDVRLCEFLRSLIGLHTLTDVTLWQPLLEKVNTRRCNLRSAMHYMSEHYWK